MYKITYQVKTYLEMMQMGSKEWQKCLAIAKTIVENVRQELKLFAETGDKAHKEKADELKRSLPGICFQAADFELSVGTKKFNKGKKGHWREQLKAYLSGLVVIDVDHCGNPRELFERIKGQFDLKALGILLVYVSASGEGLKIVFKARAEWGNLICNQYEMAALLGILDFVDDACKDSSRLSFVTGEDDVLYLDAEELFDGEEDLFPALEEGTRSDYDMQFGDRYRTAPNGDSSPTEQKWIEFEAARKAQRKAAAKSKAKQTPAAVEPTAVTAETTVKPSTEPAATAFTEREQAIIRMLNEHYGESLAEGQRHATFCQQTAHWLTWLADNNPQRAIAMAHELAFVKHWAPQPGEVEDLIQSAASKKLLKRTPKELQELLAKAGIEVIAQKAAAQGTDPMADLPFDRWCSEIEGFFDAYPCLREVCQPHPRRLWPFLLFASAAMMGTCMTLTYYRFYADSSKRYRLNYIILGVGDPTSGKGTLDRLQELLLAPIIEADKLADEATNAWKEMKGNAGDKATRARDKIFNRMFGPRASNTEFIRSMINHRTMVDGEEMNIHLVTVDTEKDNSINMSKSGGWQNRDIMALKAFHNEIDSQHYSNNQSVSGRFRIFWNQIETCTPPTLHRLVNERNFNTGLDTRMATIPMGKPDFDMMPLVSEKDTFLQMANETLREWSYRLDQRRGELPIWPLVEHVHKWCDERRAIADFNDQDQADWLLIKRVPYYGINITAPYIDMRHWEEREQTGTYLIDDTDRALCDLVLDIQYRTQLHWFYQLHRKYYDEQMVEAANYRRRTTKFVECFRKLPEEFSTEKFAEVFGYANNRSGQKTLQRLLDDKAIKRTMRGNYKKLTSEL